MSAGLVLAYLPLQSALYTSIYLDYLCKKAWLYGHAFFVFVIKNGKTMEYCAFLGRYTWSFLLKEQGYKERRN